MSSISDSKKERPIMVLDASNQILGRLASHAAKQALLGREVIVVDCDKAIILGRKRSIINEYKESRQRGGASLNGPNFPKHSERLMKRTIRGMLHYNHGRGKAAFKRIKCFSKVPIEYESIKKSIPIKKVKTKSISLNELSKEI